MDVLHGRCLCGRVRLEIATPTLTSSHCHCESCRRAHSAPLVTWTSLPRTQLRVAAGRDGLTRFESSPGVYRSFCGRCGSQLLYEGNAEPETIYVPTACLTSAPDLLPTRHVSIEEKIDWLDVADALPKVRGKGEGRATT